MGSIATDTLFTEDLVPQAPEDPLFGLMAAYRKDTFDKKVDLGIGAYRDNNAKPWVLPVVKKVRPTALFRSFPVSLSPSPSLSFPSFTASYAVTMRPSPRVLHILTYPLLAG